MGVDERSRLQLADAAKRAFGDDAGITLMELLPPVGWADVATKRDVAHLETVMNLRFSAADERFVGLERSIDALDGHLARLDSDLRAQTWKLMTLMIAVVGVVVAAVRL